ncbi:MAG: cytochrome c3 family protein [Pseudobdellovibrio sp.]
MHFQLRFRIKPNIFFKIYLIAALFFMSGCLWDSPDAEHRSKYAIGYNNGYSPEQPLPFSHEMHVGKNQIQCQYCHNQVERSKTSNIPALSTCMNCHQQVSGTANPEAIQKLRDAYNDNKSIEWVKVHMLPDHVKFNHQAHVARGVNCQTCHGPIEKMAKVYQFSDLSMGWCINCHRQPENKAPLNCTTCHQ